MIPYPKISPEIFSIGPLVVRWYGLMYVIGYVLGFYLIKKRAQQGLLKVNYRACESYITYLIVGMLLGARIIYALVYNWDYYSVYPLHIFRVWEGGLSFHGAVIGMTVSSWLFGRRHGLSFYAITDTMAYVAPPGIFFGRMGNFINAELYGRVTDVPWAMIFPTDPQKLPRHPSQLYQGLTEGWMMFAILYFIQKRALKSGKFHHGLMGGSFLVGYGILRFLTEFTREPDAQLGFVLGPFSMGQVLCFLMILAGIFVLWHSARIEKIFKPKAPDPEFLKAV